MPAPDHSSSPHNHPTQEDILTHPLLAALCNLDTAALNLRGETKLISNIAQQTALPSRDLNCDVPWHLDLYQPRYPLSRQVVQKICGTQLARKLLNPLEGRHCGTFNHCHRVAEMTCDLAIEKGLSDWEIVTTTAAALFHDIGKKSEPDSFWLAPRKFEPDETKRARKHVTLGVRELMREQRRELNPIATLVAKHHMFHKDGYPRRLTLRDYERAQGSDKKALECLMILTAADFFDALQDPVRRYRDKGLRNEDLRKIMEEHFTGDPALIDLVFTRMNPDRQRTQ